MAHFTVTVTMDSSADALLEPTPALPPSAGLRTGRSNQLAERYALRIQQGRKVDLAGFIAGQRSPQGQFRLR